VHAVHLLELLSEANPILKAVTGYPNVLSMGGELGVYQKCYLVGGVVIAIIIFQGLICCSNP
jgi:hypothetical protein